ncbi:MAG: hypothetical protein JNN01_23460 [Opitutaceae bacterium]|nr:hypothetical protein [Opitutaceae bacterium]
MSTLLQILFQILPFLIVVAVAVGWIWSGVWSARDATNRGKPGLLVGLLVLMVAWPVSLLVWIALRPENKRPPFDLNRYRVQ